MANGKQAKARRLKMAERAAAIMGIHFPNFPDVLVWRRSTNDGFTTVPRSLPIAMQAVDENCKGQPPGHTLFCLWARAPDHPLVQIDSPAVFAAEAGFTGVRAVDTWRRRMKALVKFGFIRSKASDFRHVLLLNPNAAVERMRRCGYINDELYGRFTERLLDIGANGELGEPADLGAAWNQIGLPPLPPKK